MQEKKYFKCIYELKNKIRDTRWLSPKEVYFNGSVRGFFNSKEDIIEHAKKSSDFKEIISVFSNGDITNLAKKIRQELKNKGYVIKHHYLCRYKSNDEFKSLAGVDMITIQVDNPKKAEEEDIIKRHNIRDICFAKNNIPYANIYLD